MRAAIYARRSTEEHQQASIHVQVDEARRFIERKGWSFCEERIFIDDAISRSEFVKRPALDRLKAAARGREFDVVIVRDESRLGGDMLRTTVLLVDLIAMGVRIHYYFDDTAVTLRTAHAKLQVMLRNFGAEAEGDPCRDPTTPRYPLEDSWDGPNPSARSSESH